jgi:hypothetical protein
MKPAFFFFALLAACHEEPPIVIKFEPADLSAKKQVVDASTPPPAVDASAPAPQAKSANECKKAADCALEPVECCDCANGGKQHAIAKAKLAASAAERKKRCKDSMCTEMFSTDPSCGQRAECVSGSCVMVPSAKPSPRR